MIRNFFRKNKIKNRYSFVEPDEIFLDSKNVQNFDQQQFEGRIEKPISHNTVYALAVFIFLIFISFSLRLGYLQIEKGQAYLERSENNVLEKQIIFNDRGIIYDRNKVELAWNKKEGDDLVPKRIYLSPGFSHVLGYVSYPMKDKSGNFWQTEFMGKDGLEKQYNENLRGINGEKIVEVDVRGQIFSENIVNTPKRGQDLITSIDSRVQKVLYEGIKELSEISGYVGGAGVIMDVRNGEILASTSFPEYSGEILSQGEDREKINSYLNDKRKVFLDRTISGLYTPGSIVKPFFAIAALAENIIDPYKKILSTGSISIPNPYFPGQESVFKDWKAHGYTDMREAIAVSSDVYFYEIGGGYKDQKGLGILNLEKYSRLFGIGEETGVDVPDEKSGVIPNPDWKAKNFKGDIWRIGDTYNTAIGQYGFQVTPMEMTRAVGSIANDGVLLTPHYILGDKTMEQKIRTVELDKNYFKIAREGMRLGVTEGTSSILNVPYLKVASKTGTAQVGITKNRINSWIMGFFPYENPKYAFTVMMESAPSSSYTGAGYAMRKVFDWMSVYGLEYIN